MNPLILMGVIVIVPTLLVTLLRVRAALIFMSLCVGVVLSNLVGDTALDMVQLFARSYSQATQSTVELGLLLAPVILSLLFLMHTITPSKRILNLFPATLTGIMLLLVVTPLLPPTVMDSIYSTDAWRQLTQYQAALVSVTVLISLAQLWGSSRGDKIKNSKRGRHKK